MISISVQYLKNKYILFIAFEIVIEVFERKDNFSLSFALLKSKKIKGIDSQKFSVNLKHNLSQVFYRSFKDKFQSLKDRSAIYNCSLSTLLIKTCFAHMMKLRYYSATSIRTQVREFASVCKGASKVIGYPYPQNNRCHISLIYYSSGLEFLIAKSLFTFQLSTKIRLSTVVI